MTRILEFTDPGQDDLVSLRPDSRLLHAWLDDDSRRENPELRQ